MNSKGIKMWVSHMSQKKKKNWLAPSGGCSVSFWYAQPKPIRRYKVGALVIQ